MKEPKNVTNNFNILNICPFGQEPAIQHEDVKPLLTLPAKSVPKYIQMKHFTSSDTKNVCLTNVRGNTIQVVEEDQDGTRKWVQRDRNQTIYDMTESNLEELKEKHKALRVAVWKQWYEESGLSGNGYYKTDAWKEIQKQVELLLLNNRIRGQAPL